MAQNLHEEMSSSELIQAGMSIGMSERGRAFLGNKKGNFQMLSATAKSLVVFGIMIGMGLLILGEFQDSVNSSSTAYTEIGNVAQLFSDLTTWGAIVLIVIMGYVILRYLGVFEG